MIDGFTIQRVRGEVSLLELCREYGMVFRRQGSDWWAPCPFHVEQSGSFKVDGKKNFYKCFGCGAKGDVLSFYLDRNGLDRRKDFYAAVKFLAGRVGIVVDSTGTGKQAVPKRKRRSREEIEAAQREREDLGTAVRAREAMDAVLMGWAVSYGDFVSSSPVDFSEASGVEQARSLMGIFPADDVVWCGEVTDSIAAGAEAEAWRVERVRGCFRRAGDWAVAERMAGSRVCACSFKAGVLARGLESVAAQRFFVVEHDKLPLDGQCAIFRWLREHVGLDLRAVVFTGGKSLHGWFGMPESSRDLARLKLVLCGTQREETQTDGRVLRVWRGGMGLDGAGFNAVQPWKVPGWLHGKTGKPAELVWRAAV